MFKVGDRVKRLINTHDGSIPIGTKGTVTVEGGYPRVQFDNGINWGCDHSTIALISTYTYAPGDKVVWIAPDGSVVNRGDVGEYISKSNDLHLCKFNGTAFYLTDSQLEPYVRSDSDPIACVLCGTFSPMAEPNLPGGLMACWSCRTYRAAGLRAVLR